MCKHCSTLSKLSETNIKVNYFKRFFIKYLILTKKELNNTIQQGIIHELNLAFSDTILAPETDLTLKYYLKCTVNTSTYSLVLFRDSINRGINFTSSDKRFTFSFPAMPFSLFATNSRQSCRLITSLDYLGTS